MEKKVRDGTLASVALIVGGLAIFVLKETIEGLILIIFSGLITWFNPDLRELILSFIKLISKKFSSENNQVMRESYHSVQGQAGRDLIINNIINEGGAINKKTNDRQNRNDAREEEALRTIYKKMTIALREVNRVANVGLKNKEEYTKVNKTVEEFISAKMDYEIDIDATMKSKFDEVMGSFRHTMHELYLIVSKNKFNQGVHGTKSFDFINKSKEATEMIKERLRG